MPARTTREFAEFNRLLASAVERGVGLEVAIEVLSSQAVRPRWREILQGVSAALKEGECPPAAFDRFPDAFSDDYRAMVRAGYESGRLAEVFRSVETYTTLEANVTRKVKRLAAYLGMGAVLCAVLLAVGWFMAYQMLAFYDQLGIGEAGDGLFGPSRPQGVGYVLVASTLLAAAGLAVFVFLFTWGGKNRLGYGVPIWGAVLKSRDLAYFCTTTAMRLRAGAVLHDALSAAERTVPNRHGRRMIGAARERVEGGESLSTSLFYHRYFPRTVSWAVSLGEQRGDLDETFESLARVYSVELERRLDLLLMMMTPVGILLLGNLVLAAAAAVLGPLFMMHQVLAT